ncbi:MAG: rhomboid family intramembrane serine protease [Myxococcales bacterium]|nr:rhomboid family intramembrane serine protease [Myxococcales bacterium]
MDTPVGEAPPDAIVRRAARREAVEAWALVLASQSIPHAIVRTFADLPEGAGPSESPRSSLTQGEVSFALVVPVAQLRRAAVALAKTESEDAERASTPDVQPPDRGRPLAPALVCVALALFFLLTGPRAGNSFWFSHGSAEATAILSGALERAVTGMTLHADAMHLAGNVIAMLVFLSAVARWLGGGLSVLLMVVAGFLGNVTTAYIYVNHHDSVGASTATFAALGLLGGLQARHRVRHGWWHRNRRFGRALPALAACLGLFAMLGVGESAQVDVVAHLAGLGWGLPFGAAGAWLPPVSRPLNIALGLCAAAVVGLCWALAF